MTISNKLKIDKPQVYEYKLENITRLFELKFNTVEVYHHHKETMANAGMLLQIAIASGLFSQNPFPDWIFNISNIFHLNTRWTLITIYLVLAVFIHVFIRWQLRNRRIAAITSAALNITLRKWALNKPSDSELELNKATLQESCCLINFFDKYIIPFPKSMIKDDIGLVDWPKGYYEVFDACYKNEIKYNSFPPQEWLLTLGSILVILLCSVRIYLGTT